jgi:hypothetical protein
MNVRVTLAALLAIGLSSPAFAQSPMREGNWEILSKMNMPGMNMPAQKQVRCITAAMIKDPQSAIEKPPGSEGCKMSDYKLSGDTTTYKMACTQPPATMTGEVKHLSPEAYTAKITMDMSGQSMLITVDAKRIGDCPAP